MLPQSYIDKTYLEENNLKHRIKIYNKTKNVDISEYLDNDTLEISKFLENETQSIAANTLDLTFLKPETDKSSGWRGGIDCLEPKWSQVSNQRSSCRT